MPKQKQKRVRIRFGLHDVEECRGFGFVVFRWFVGFSWPSKEGQ